MIRRPIRRARNRRAIRWNSPTIQLDATFQVIDFENPTVDAQTRVRIRADQPVILNETPEDISIVSAGDPTQSVECVAALAINATDIDLFFPSTFPDTSQIASSDLLNVPFGEDDIRTESAGVIDASQRTMEPVIG